MAAGADYKTGGNAAVFIPDPLGSTGADGRMSGFWSVGILNL
jgi:hypothetical protein